MSAFISLLFVTFIGLEGTGMGASVWTVAVPPEVKGLQTSCVVIPCSFDYPDPTKEIGKIRGIWTDIHNQIVYHPDELTIFQQYQNRVRMLGNVREKNCSLQIDNVTPNDKGPYVFRVEIQGYDRYSFIESKVTVSVASEPDPVNFFVSEELRADQTAFAYCSVSHSCPSAPPEFSWSHEGKQSLNVQRTDNDRWAVTSTLTFRASHTDHKKSLQCKITYNGGKQQNSFKTLDVKYAPVKVMVYYNKEIREGGTAELQCTSDPHPPVRKYLWYNETGGQVKEGNLYIVSNVSRHVGSFYCTAINEMGEKQSEPVQLNVLYAPDITSESRCFSERSFVTCKCIVDSNPSSVVHFQLGEKILQAFQEENSSTTFTLRSERTDFDSSASVLCSASNSEGSVNFTLSLPFKENLLQILILSGAGVIVVTLIFVSVVTVQRKLCSSTKNSDTTCPSERAIELPQSSTIKRNDVYSHSQCAGIYSNVDVFQYKEDDSEAVYDNI